MNKTLRFAGIILLMFCLMFTLAACGQRNSQPEPTPDENRQVVVETAPPSPTPTPTPTPSLPPATVTTVPMPMPSVSPTVSVTNTPTVDGSEAGSPNASPAVSPSASPSPSPSAAPVYSADAAFASTIKPDTANVPANTITGYINANGVVLRGGPSGSAVILGTFDIGTPVDIVGSENGWTEVYVSGVMGYVKDEYVTYGSAYVNYGPSTYITDSGSSEAQVVIPDGGYDSVTVISGIQNQQDNWNPNLGIKPD